MKIKNVKFIKGILGTDKIIDEDIVHVAFFGRSNVGKSSIINTVLNRNNLVKSSSKPGKTREINFFKIDYRDNNLSENDNETRSIYFVDLPGYGYARLSPKQRESIRKMIIWYLAELPKVKKVNVVVLDAKVGLTNFDKEVLNIISETNQKALIVINKIDKLNQKNKKKILDEVTKNVDFDVVLFSSLKKRGIKDFFNVVKKIIKELN